MKCRFDELRVGDQILVEVGMEGNYISGYISSITVEHVEGKKTRTRDEGTITVYYVSEGVQRHLEFCNDCESIVINVIGHDMEELLCLMK